MVDENTIGRRSCVQVVFDSATLWGHGKTETLMLRATLTEADVEGLASLRSTFPPSQRTIWREAGAGEEDSGLGSLGRVSFPHPQDLVEPAQAKDQGPLSNGYVKWCRRRRPLTPTIINKLIIKREVKSRGFSIKNMLRKLKFVDVKQLNILYGLKSHWLNVLQRRLLHNESVTIRDVNFANLPATVGDLISMRWYNIRSFSLDNVKGLALRERWSERRRREQVGYPLFRQNLYCVTGRMLSGTLPNYLRGRDKLHLNYNLFGEADTVHSQRWLFNLLSTALQMSPPIRHIHYEYALFQAMRQEGVLDLVFRWLASDSTIGAKLRADVAERLSVLMGANTPTPRLAWTGRWDYGVVYLPDIYVEKFMSNNDPFLPAVEAAYLLGPWPHRTTQLTLLKRDASTILHPTTIKPPKPIPLHHRLSTRERVVEGCRGRHLKGGEGSVSNHTSGVCI